MKKIKKIPTILGVLFLIIGLIAGVFSINSKQNIQTEAITDYAPKNVRVTNVTDNSLTITWTTDKKSVGFIKWGKNKNNLSKVILEENQEKEFVHSIDLLNIETNTDVFFEINSEGKDFDNDKIPWQSKTLSQKIKPKKLSSGSGKILSLDGSTPSKAIVYLSINGVSLSNLTSREGSWLIPISTYTETAAKMLIEISVIDGQGGSAQAVIYSDAIKTTPTIVIGKTYDFKNYTSLSNTNLPESKLTIPESTEISSRFEVDKSNFNLPNKTVTLDSIDDGEIITTINPEFFGTAPTSTEIEVSVESELQTEILTTGSNGKWVWNPPKNLEAGEHNITLKWRDENGILKTLTRKFIVQAGEAPAFEATPSATPNSTPTVSPTSTPNSTAEPDVTTTPLATILTTPTNLPLPVTGDLTSTLGLFIMGIGILMSSIFIWNKA